MKIITLIKVNLYNTKPTMDWLVIASSKTATLSLPTMALCLLSRRLCYLRSYKWGGELQGNV
jgi:hypothetical protein